MKSRKSRAFVFMAWCALLSANSVTRAQTTPLLNVVHTVAAPTVAVPVEHSFDIATPGTYQVTLVDLGAALATPAPLASVKLAITSGSTAVTLTPPGATAGSTGTPVTELSAAGSATFTATAGTYVVHVIGMPGTVFGSGPIGITITNTADNTQLPPYSDTLALPPGSSASSTQSVLDDSFTVSTAGSYQVTLSDLDLPQPLSTLTLAIVPQGGGSLLTTLTVSEPGSTTATGTVSLQPGVTYRIFGAGQSGTTPAAGLFGVNVSPAGGGAPVYSKTLPVGAVTLLGSAALTAGNSMLSLSDLAFPSALSQLEVAVALNGQGVTQLSAAGTKTFVATANTYQVFGVGAPSTSTTGSYPGTGSYSVALQAFGGTTALSVTRAVSAGAMTASGSTIYAYSFDTSTVSGETYALSLADFATPNQFTGLTAAAVQGGVVLGTPLTAAGTQNITPAAGPVSLLVFAAAANKGGLFGVNLTAVGAGSPAFETTQAVGQLFSAQKVTVTTGGNYSVTASDVGFPAPFANFAVVVTRGTSLLGSIYGAGTFNFAAIGGDYFVNLVAQPGGTDNAGTYALSVGPAPPAPTVTIQSSAPSVASGSTVTLTWSSQNATSCLASGGWTGSQAVSGTATSAALTAATTFTLTCTGAGGNTAQSVTVNITAPPSGGGKGGGGSIGGDLLAVLFGLLLLGRIVPATSRPGTRGILR